MFLAGSARLGVRHHIISKQNWGSVRTDLLKIINQADFVAFDYEFTGLHSKNDRYLGLDMAYEAHASGVKQFIPIQLGICAGKYDPISKTWELTPSSIYLYPSTPLGDESVGRCFSVSTSALNFLVANGLDCNEWISSGMSSLQPREEEDRKRTIRARIAEIQSLQTSFPIEVPTNSTSSSAPHEIPEGPEKNQLVQVGKQIREWLESATDSSLIEIPMESAYLRLLAHTYIAKEFPQLFSHSSKKSETGERVLCVYKDRNRLFAEQLSALNRELDRVDSEVGPRQIFDHIMNGKVPLVGHNCFYDMMHTYQTFFDEVPSHLTQFKSGWMKRFSKTFDTKYLAESAQILGGLQPPATLKGLCQFMLSNANSSTKFQVVPLADGYEYELPSGTNDSISSGDFSHDAGYDALMTSVVFLCQLGHLIERRGLSFAQVEFGTGRTPGSTAQKIPLTEILRQGVNRIRLVKTQPNFVDLAERA